MLRHVSSTLRYASRMLHFLKTCTLFCVVCVGILMRNESELPSFGLGRKISKECNWLIRCLIIWAYKNCTVIEYIQCLDFKINMLFVGFDYQLENTTTYSIVPPRVEYRYAKSVSWYIDIFALYHDTYRYVPPFLQILLQSDFNCVTCIQVKTFE
jgi:hypothetical protein